MTLSPPLAAWLRRVGLPVVDTRRLGPRWLNDGDVSALQVAAGRLERLGDELDEIRTDLGRLLGGAARTLGWEGDAAATAAARTARTGARLAELADLLREVGRELLQHGMRLEDSRAELRHLVDEAEHHVAAAGDALWSPSPLTLVGEPTDGHDHVGALHRLARRMQDVLEDADTSDRACASRVVDLGAAVLDLVGRAESDHWVGDVVPASAREVLPGLGPPGGAVRSPRTSEDR